MSKLLLKDGHLTLRAALYLSALLISIGMGFSAKFVGNFLQKAMDGEFVVACAILFKVIGLGMTYMQRSPLMLRWISENFTKFIIVMDVGFFILALIGQDFPMTRYVGYELICIVGVKLLKAVQRDNLNNCINGTAKSIFEAKVDSIAFVGAVGGGVAMLVISRFVEVGVNAAMIVECLCCLGGHWLQRYVNYRIVELGIYRKEKVTFIEAFNQVCKSHKNKKISKDEDDTIFDQ